MKGGTRAALALGVGYLLGRRRKLRTAAVLAAATAAGGTGVSATALRRGMKVLGSTEVLNKFSPQLGNLADTIQGDLVSAGKAAATAAVSNRLESLTDSLHDRTERLRNPDAVVEDVGETVSGAGETVRGGVRGAGRRVRPQTEDEYDDVPADEMDDEYEDEPRSGSSQPADEEAGEPEEPRARPRRRAGAGRSPVARTRR